jgi:DNA repair exonuclease SbcCD ATPase subunit
VARKLAAAGLVGAAIGVAWPAAGLAQSPDVLNALLAEVRGLRAAMEEVASSGTRAQLLLGRLQLQEQRVNALNGRLDAVRKEIAGNEQVAAAMEDELKRATEASQNQSLPPAMQRQMEDQLRHIKPEYLRRQTEIQRLQQAEASLSQELASEQGRWNDFNRTLEELERSLARR